MAAHGIVCVLGLLAITATNGAAVSPVQKVLQLIDDFTAKVKGDLSATNSEFEEFAKMCDDDVTAKNYAIKSTKEQITALTASVDDAGAKISVLESKVEDLTSTISATEAELASAISMREKERAEFVATEAQMLETVKELAAGAETLEKTLGLVQLTPGAKKALDGVMGSLSQIVEANFVTHAQRKLVRAFLQEKEDAEESFTLHARSPAVLETLQAMLGRAEGTLTATRKKEVDNGHAAALLKAGIEQEIASLKEELSETTKAKQASVEVKASTEKDLAVETKGLREDQSTLSDAKMECQQRATQYEADVRDNEAELTALGKAKAILVKKFALLQTHTAVEVTSRSVEDPRALALRRIEQLGKKFHSTALVALAYRAAGDPFGKVRSMVEEMIAKLMQDAAEEADKKAFCDAEIGKSTKSKAEKEESLAKTQARIDKASASVAKLTELIATLGKEIADIDSAVAEASALREKEKATFLKVEADMAASEEACAAAISVLREYYEGASLVQVKAETKAAVQRDGGGIISILEVAEEDFAKLLAEARSIESSAASDYEKLMQDSKMSKATKEMDLKGKKSEIKSLQTALADYGEDKEGTTSELEAVLGYLDKLKPQCETVAPSYEEVKAARDSEIAGLKEALKILSGSAAALPQTGHRGLRGFA